MIAKGMPIQIRRSGTSVPVEQLEIGSLVYNPITDNYIEIIDILSRQSKELSSVLMLVPKSRLGFGVPSEDLVLSHQQPIGMTTRTQFSGPPSFEFRPAHILGTERWISTTLFALFGEVPGCVSVAGAILSVFDASSLRVSLPDRQRPTLKDDKLRQRNGEGRE